MSGQTDRLLTRARERFAVQDYYGAVHLLEEIVDGGRAFADVHHLLGVSLSLLGQAERALPPYPEPVQPPGTATQRAQTEANAPLRILQRNAAA